MVSYSDRLRRRRPTIPMPIAHTPRMSITPEDGSGTGAKLSPLAPCAAPITMHANNDNFMSSILPKESFRANKPKAQNRRRSTNTGFSTGDLSARPFQYLAALVLALSFTVHCTAEEPKSIELKLPAHFDPLAVDAPNQYSAAAKLACAEPKQVGFVGYVWRLPAVAAELRQMTGESFGKQIYIAFLKAKYGYQISKLNADYGTDAQSFTELLESPMKDGLAEHDAEFNRPVRAEMVQGILEALRKCDPAHADGVLRLLSALQ